MHALDGREEGGDGDKETPVVVAGKQSQAATTTVAASVSVSSPPPEEEAAEEPVSSEYEDSDDDVSMASVDNEQDDPTFHAPSSEHDPDPAAPHTPTKPHDGRGAKNDRSSPLPASPAALTSPVDTVTSTSMAGMLATSRDPSRFKPRANLPAEDPTAPPCALCHQRGDGRDGEGPLRSFRSRLRHTILVHEQCARFCPQVTLSQDTGRLLGVASEVLRSSKLVRGCRKLCGGGGSACVPCVLFCFVLCLGWGFCSP